MQDRYLFRGKRKDNGEWTEGSLIINTAVQTTPFIVDSCFGEKGKTNEDGYEEFDWLSAYEVDPATVGQCAGLKDKNGELIFEGDLVTVVGYSYTEPEIVESGEMDITPLGFALWDDEICRHKNLSDLQGRYTTIYEIYGNIHDKEGEND